MIEKKEPCNLCRKHGFIISVSFSTKDCDMTTIGCFDKEENLNMFFDSARQAANKFDVEPSFVCSCCRNEKWAFGYHWKYIVNN